MSISLLALLSASCEQLARENIPERPGVLLSCGWETPANQGFAQQILLALLLLLQQQRVGGALNPVGSKSTWHSLCCVKIHGHALWRSAASVAGN